MITCSYIKVVSTVGFLLMKVIGYVWHVKNNVQTKELTLIFRL